MTITYNPSDIEQIPAGQDLSSYQNHFVKLNTSGQVVPCDAAGEMPYGILLNKPDASGKIADVVVRPGVRALLVVGGSVAINDKLKTNASARGAAIQAAYTNTSDAGVAQDALVGSYFAAVVTDKVGTTANGDTVQVKLVLGGAVPTTAA